MVPAPRPFVPPLPYTKVDPSIHTTPETPAEPLPFLKNTSGRNWKQPHKATARAQAGKKDAAQATNAFAKREEIRKRDEAVKKLERCVFDDFY